MSKIIALFITSAIPFLLSQAKKNTVKIICILETEILTTYRHLNTPHGVDDAQGDTLMTIM